jgi:hypothetical protein
VRAYLYGLAAAGSLVVSEVIEILGEELRRTRSRVPEKEDPTFWRRIVAQYLSSVSSLRLHADPKAAPNVIPQRRAPDYPPAASNLSR